jgi:hypothetical protein
MYATATVTIRAPTLENDYQFVGSPNTSKAHFDYLLS